jgi:PPOX class probable F420-dependent enzyme
MDLDEAREFIRAQHRAVLATMRRDGTPQLSPVTCGVDDSGAVVVSTRDAAAKTHNARRDPRAWLCVFTDGFFGRFVQVQGSVTVVDLPEAMPGLIDYYRSISGEHPDWDDYRAAMEREQRVLLRLELTRAGPDYSG